jgi:hypothetical protein
MNLTLPQVQHPEADAMTPIDWSRHAITRAQQRGITPAQIDAVRRYADMDCPRGGGCVSIWISMKELQQLAPSTPEGISIDRLQGLIVLESEDAACVTIVRNRKSKTYRRPPRGRR